MDDPLVELEGEILTLLSQANRPLKARAIAVLLSGKRATSLHKRDVNPTLYRMLSQGRLFLDSEFRWSPNRGSLACTLPSDGSLSHESEKHSESSIEIRAAASVVEYPPPGGDCEGKPYVDLPSAKATNAGGISEVIVNPPPETRVLGNLRVKKEMRPYERHCTWCSQRIPERELALVVDGARQGRPRFCSEDCFQNWESLYWQRLAISHLGLTREELRLEQKNLRLQRRFSRFT